MKITASMCDCNPVAKRGVSVYASELTDWWYKYNGTVITDYRYNKDQIVFHTECFYYAGSISFFWSVKNANQEYGASELETWVKIKLKSNALFLQINAFIIVCICYSLVMNSVLRLPIIQLNRNY